MKAFNKNGIWGVVVAPDEKLICSVCNEPIQVDSLFFFCEAKKHPFHDECKKGFKCSDVLDLHEDYIIRFVEVEKC